MTEFDIQESLFDRFCSLNDFAKEQGFDGNSFLDIDESKVDISERQKYTNVHFPNLPFTVPESKQYYELTFRNNEPETVAIMDGAQNRFTGVLYIDIITPQDTGEDEARNKYEWIARLFTQDIYVGDVVVMKCYISTKGNEADHYRLQCAIEWTADIDKE